MLKKPEISVQHWRIQSPSCLLHPGTTQNRVLRTDRDDLNDKAPMDIQVPEKRCWYPGQAITESYVSLGVFFWVGGGFLLASTLNVAIKSQDNSVGKRLVFSTNAAGITDHPV